MLYYRKSGGCGQREMEQRVDAPSPEAAAGDADRIVLASDALPTTLDDHARFKLWQDMYVAAYCEFDVMRVEHRPFSARTEYRHFGQIGVANTVAGVERLVRNRQHVAVVPRANFCLALNTGSSPIIQKQLGRDTTHQIDHPTLVTEGEPGDIGQPGGYSFFLLDIPPQLLLERVAGAFDLVARPLTAAPHATAHLRRYVEVLQRLDVVGEDPALREHVAATLLDLVSLVLGAQGDFAAIARARGLRAARLQSILAAIRNGYTDPAISPQRVGLKLGLSARYVNELVHETGTGFTERVLELRLQKARAMLAERRHDRLKVIDIAYEFGFSDVSYFNRCFRRRFGVPPSDIRFERARNGAG